MKSNDTLKELVANYNEKKLLTVPAQGEDIHSHRIKEGKARQAREQLLNLRGEIRTEIAKRACFIILTGDKMEQFITIATEKYGCYLSDSNLFYNTLVSEVNPQLYKNTSASSVVFDIVSQKFEEIAMNLGIASFPALLFEAKYKKLLSNREDLVNVVSEAFNEKIGGEVVGMYAVDYVTDSVINEDGAGKVIPILITTDNAKTASDIFKDLRRLGDLAFTVTAGESTLENVFHNVKSPTNKSVEETLLKIKNSL